jgi:hypothetical protein
VRTVCALSISPPQTQTENRGSLYVPVFFFSRFTSGKNQSLSK